MAARYRVERAPVCHVPGCRDVWGICAVRNAAIPLAYNAVMCGRFALFFVIY